MKDFKQNKLYKVVMANIHIVIKLIAFALLLLALVISSAMVKLIFGCLGIAALLFWALEEGWILKGKLPLVKRYALPLFCVVFVGLSLFYNMRNLSRVIPLQKHTNQRIYQEEYKEAGMLPDAYLRNLIADKTVYVPYKVKTYDYYNKWGDEEERADKFANKYYTENNYTRYFLEYSKVGVTDAKLPDMDSFTEFLGEGDDREAFTKKFDDYGIANDMLRYSFLLNQEHSKETAYFWYAWFYYSFANEKQRYPHIYVMTKECSEAKELAAIWDKRENIFILPYEMIESCVKRETNW